MSRSGYSDDCDGWRLIMWRGAVTSAIKGSRGQQFLRELAEGMDAMPVKELIANALVADGAYCAMGVVGAKRGVDMSKIDPDEPSQVSKAFDIAAALAQEIAFINDDDYSYRNDDPARRWHRVRRWVDSQIVKATK